MTTKTCTQCGATKPLDDFPHRSRSKDGHGPQCDACNRERARLWRLANVERHRANTERWSLANRDKALADKRAWHQRNRDANNTRRRAHYQANWLAASIAARNRYAREKGAEGVFTLADVLALWELQRGRCAYCGGELGDRYHLDHVRPIVRGGTNWPDNLAATCRRCNLRKHHMTGEEFRTMLREEESS